MLISFMPGMVESRKTYADWKHPLKISHSFSELKNDSRISLQLDILFPLVSEPQCTFMGYHFAGKLNHHGPATLFVGSLAQLSSSRPILQHDSGENIDKGLLPIETIGKNSLFG